ncbi:hypothetical protein VTK56DRAFT_1288 [Thermocarpiscus australiensis]
MLPLIFAASFLAPVVAGHSGRHPLVARGDGFIRAPVNATPGPTRRLLTRQNEVGVENQRSGTRYAVQVDVGTPPQQLTLILDTGSPDTWINPSCETANVPEDCNSFPRYDYTKSSSLNVTGAEDTLVYGIGNATVQYVYETVTIGSATIEHQIIGIATASHSIPLGILGMSPPIRGANEYPYILDTMVDQGLIKSRAFSLDLRGVGSTDGALIFGGIDTGKYIGALAKLPMLAPEATLKGLDRYYVTMTGVGLTFPDGSVVQSEAIEVPVFLDSGSTFSYLPTSIYQAIAAGFPDAQFDPRSGYYFVDCAVLDLAGSVDFYFGGKAIRVPLSDFIWQIEGYCVLGVVPDDDEPVLGDSFLRAAYVVFDQDNRNLHLAQAANCGTALVAIGSGPDAVPSSIGRCTALPTPTGSSGGGGGGGSLDVTATRSPTNTFTGTGPTGVVLGPGPAASKVSGSGAPQATGSSNDAGRSGGVICFWAAAALSVLNVMAWVV